MTLVMFLICAAVVVGGFILIPVLKLNAKESPLASRWEAVEQRRSRDRWAGTKH